MELSMSLKPAEFEVQNIEFIEEELLDNFRIDSRYSMNYENALSAPASAQTISYT